MVLGYELSNRASGSTWGPASASISGPDGEHLPAIINERVELEDASYHAVNPYFAGANLGALIEYRLSERVGLQVEFLYTIALSPFLGSEHAGLIRHGMNAGAGLTFALSGL